jgi:hypothetical protein
MISQDSKEPRHTLRALAAVLSILIFALIGVGESFQDDCDDHGHQDCSSDCGCLLCGFAETAAFISMEADDLLDGPVASFTLALDLTSEDDWVLAIDHPPQRSA